MLIVEFESNKNKSRVAANLVKSTDESLSSSCDTISNSGNANAMINFTREQTAKIIKLIQPADSPLDDDIRANVAGMPFWFSIASLSWTDLS